MLFKRLLEAKGVKRGSGRHNEKTETVAVLAKSIGVDERTARHRVALADAYEKLPDAHDHQSTTTTRQGTAAAWPVQAHNRQTRR